MGMTLHPDVVEDVVVMIHQPCLILCLVGGHRRAGDFLRIDDDVGDGVGVLIRVFVAERNAVPCDFLVKFPDKRLHFLPCDIREVQIRTALNGSERFGE